MIYNEIKNILKSESNLSRAKLLQVFFKTQKGEYGEGDIFIGLTVPKIRKISNDFYLKINYSEINALIQSKIHEERLLALFILILKLKKYPEEDKNIFYFYIKNIKYINNWDLVDTSAGNIIGKYLINKNKDILYKFAINKNLWIRRISIISTFYFIKNNQFEDAIKISQILLNDKHDLIHKAVGWMLREIGKKNKQILLNFLNLHYKEMPRTMLRYSLEKLNLEEKQYFMKK